MGPWEARREGEGWRKVGREGGTGGGEDGGRGRWE